MLTDQQIERAARKLCELRGIDPDAETVFGKFDPDTQHVTMIRVD